MEIEHLRQFSDTLTFVGVCRVVRGARLRQSIDRNSFRSPCRERDSRSVQPCPIGSTSMGTAIIRYPARAVGLMEIEHLQHFSDALTIVPIRRVTRGARCQRRIDRNLFRSSRGGARFRECSTPSARFNLCENCYNPVYASCRGAEALGYPGQSPPARAIPNYLF